MWRSPSEQTIPFVVPTNRRRRRLRLGAIALTLVCVLALQTELAGAQSLNTPSGAGVAIGSAGQSCSSVCRNWEFGAAMYGTFTLGGTPQVGSLGYVNVYSNVVSQTSTSVTFAVDPSSGFFSGSTLQGQTVSGACGGTVTVTGAITSSTLPVPTGIPTGVVTAALSCTAALGSGPSESLSISIDIAETNGYHGYGTYTTN